jgi:Fe2+ transport system protein B
MITAKILQEAQEKKAEKERIAAEKERLAVEKKAEKLRAAEEKKLAKEQAKQAKRGSAPCSPIADRATVSRCWAGGPVLVVVLPVLLSLCFKWGRLV